MTTTKIDKEIRDRIDLFLEDISQLVREAALEAVREALGTGTGPARATTKRVAATSGSVSSARTAAKRKGKRLRRSASDLEAMSKRILAHVKSNPGCRMEEISAALGEDTYDLRRPLEMLKQEKAFKTTGQKRATRYFPRATAKKKSSR